MASNNTIVKKAIQIDAGDTVRTVRSLKQEISDLRDQLLNLEKGTEEYNEVQKQLQDDVEDLNTVMGAHKEKAEALEGSYNDLQNQLKELKAAWKATNDEAERDVLGQKIKDLNDQLSAMDQSIGDFHRNVGNYESAWNGLTSTMETGEKVVDDMEKGIKAFGSAMGLTDKQVNSLSKSLKAMKDGFKIVKDIAKAKESTEGLSAAQKTAAGTATAMATSEKTAAAATTTMATAEGTATVATKGLSIAMRGLKAALISTGIGALIVLVGELAAQLDNLISKLKLARTSAFNALSESLNNNLQQIHNNIEGLKVQEDEMEHLLDMQEARGVKERDILEERIKNMKTLQDQAYEASNAALQAEIDYGAEIERLPRRKRDTDKIKEDQEALTKAVEEAKAAIRNYGEEVRNAEWALELFDEKAKHATKTTQELKKWSELVQDPKFQQAWHNLFQIDFGEGNPVDILKKQQEAAIALVQQFKGDTSEVERYFDQMISEAEAEWQSLVEKEKQIFDERLTPAQRLENEKAEWIEKAERWGMDATTIVKYYNDKIQEELDKAEQERIAKLEEEAEKAKKAVEDYLSQVDATLATQEKMDELFNPMFIQDTARGDIDQEVEAVQRLYDTQMEYLNGLLESADLTEEAYAGIEDRILSLTVTFNNQMKVLKAEQEFQGKNFAMLTRKQVANYRLMEDAAADFSATFQALGLENSIAFKAFATAQALISAFLAANRVLAEEPGGIIIKGIAAAAALAAGIANVIAIWSVDADGSNAKSVASSASQQSATPVIGNSQPINYTRNITSAEEEDAMNAPIYVTVTDIEDGIEGRRAQVTNSSF